MRLLKARQLSPKPWVTLVLLSLATIAGNAAAESDSGCTVGCEPFSVYFEPFNEYFSATGSHFLTGLNSVITSAADPVMSVVDPPEEFEELPLAAVTGRFIGIFQGTIMAAYRGAMGALDMILAPIPIVILSPEPRYQPIPGFEWDE